MFPDFEEFLQCLNAEQAEYLVVGGYAVAHHAQPRATNDLRLPDHSESLIQRSDIAEGCGCVGREAIDGTGRFIFEELRQVCSGAFNPRGQNGLAAFQAARDEVRMRQEPGNGRCGGNRCFPATSGCMTDRASSSRGAGGGTSALVFSPPGTGTKSLRRSEDRSRCAHRQP